jgi:GNAT superfamily N-acetyltransferase
MTIAHSPLETERFGVRAARGSIASAGDLDEALAFCRAEQVRFLVARTPTVELALAQRMEKLGFLIMDTLVHYVRAVSTPFDMTRAELRIGPLEAGEEEAVAEIAATAFARYSGHYHADPQLPKTRCDEAYLSWAKRSCTREAADVVLLARVGATPAAFATMERRGADAEGVLFAVAPAHQGRGIYRDLILGGLAWAASIGAMRMHVSTQITNVAVQKAWVRVGFEPLHSEYTFHRWFDR